MEFIELISINKLDGVILKYPHQDNVDGTVCITGHHLILSSRKEGVRELWLLHRNIDSIEKKENKPVGGVTQGGSLFLKCKDLRIFQLDISSSMELNMLMLTLENLSGLQDPSLFYPFFYRHMHPIMENGYTLYSIEGEFTKVLATEEWRISRVNQNYTVCPAYPKAVVVPKGVDDDVLALAATFRQGGRFPVLSYRHNNGAVLLRAGQPLYGPKHRRCRADEAALNAVVAPGMKGVIYDLRSASAISHHQNKGGGTESNANYSQWKIYNRSMDDVDNQQQLLDSYSKLIEACNDREISSDKWVSRLEACGWPESVRNALHTACIVAQHIHQKAEPVLVHGTRGEDATLLVCSLVQIILNPDCRTIRGAGGARVGGGGAPVRRAAPLRAVRGGRARRAHLPAAARLRAPVPGAVPLQLRVPPGLPRHPLRALLRQPVRHFPVRQRTGARVPRGVRADDQRVVVAQPARGAGGAHQPAVRPHAHRHLALRRAHELRHLGGAVPALVDPAINGGSRGGVPRHPRQGAGAAGAGSDHAPAAHGPRAPVLPTLQARPRQLTVSHTPTRDNP